MSNIIGKVASKIVSNDKLVKIISNGIAEGEEEFLQEYLDSIKNFSKKDVNFGKKK